MKNLKKKNMMTKTLTKSDTRLLTAAALLSIVSALAITSLTTPLKNFPNLDFNVAPAVINITQTPSINTNNLKFNNWPTIKHIISSPFGSRIQASDSPTTYDFHRGIDIPGVRGVDSVVAVAPGTIFKIVAQENTAGYIDGGKVVVIKHTAPKAITFHGITTTVYYTFYMHLDSIASGLSEGQQVSANKILGKVGDTGTTNFQHLHFEVRVGAPYSLEWQNDHPTSTSALIFNPHQDPHVNPMLFLPSDNINNTNNNAYTLTANVSSTGVLFTFQSNRSELDFNKIKMINGATVKEIDFNSRAGIDQNNIDNQEYNGIKIIPIVFNSSSQKYIINFLAEGWTNYTSAEFTDVYGKGKKLTK